MKNKVHVSIGDHGTGKVLLNGVELTGVTAVEVSASVGELVRVKLTLFAQVVADLDADVQVVRPITP